MTISSYFILFSQSLLIGLQITGTATVIDGDTIEIRGQKIRLHGIDAPESSQWCTDQAGQIVRCGQQAAFALDELLAGQTCHCQVETQDRYGRQVAICYVGKTNVNEWMVAQGWALAYQQYSADYIAAEQIAQASQQGIWQYQFEEPWAYRKGKRNGELSSSPSATARSPEAQTTSVNPSSKQVDSSSDCLIKGNISSSGKRIYHPPSSPWYTRTRIEVTKGEKWFCSEEEARRAGWQRAKY